MLTDIVKTMENANRYCQSFRIQLVGAKFLCEPLRFLSGTLCDNFLAISQSYTEKTQSYTEFLCHHIFQVLVIAKFYTKFQLVRKRFRFVMCVDNSIHFYLSRRNH